MKFLSSAAIAAILLSVIPNPALSQSAQNEEAVQTTADLQAMRARAAADPALAQQFEHIVEMARRNQPVAANRNLVRYIFQNFGGIGDDLKEPVRIDTLANLDPARRRAHAASQILVADLNGDWEITRDELMEALKYAPSDGSARAFLLADDDRNDVLGPEEIRAAISRMGETEPNGRQTPVNLMPVFDFDGDGYLTPEELDRGIKAIGR